MKKQILSILSVGILVFALTGTASAGLQVFTDSALWQAAAGGGNGDLFENFNSFTADEFYYGTNPVVAGFLELSVTNGPGDPSWLIDASPAKYGTIPAVNNSTFATTLTHPDYGDTLLSFTPVSALGFDYAGASYSDSAGILTTSRGESVSLAASGNNTRSFIGLLYTEGETFSSLTWHSSGRFAAGIDNVEAFSPVSSTLWVKKCNFII